MAKKRQRERHQNPQPFLAEHNDSVVFKKRTKSKHHQQEYELISSGMSSKIFREALVQQREIEDEEARAQNPNNSLLDASEERDIDDSGGCDETDQSHFGGYDGIDEHQEKLLEELLSKDGQQWADLIVAQIKEKYSTVASDARPLHELYPSIVKHYKEVGKFLSEYTSGKLLKALKHIPSVSQWEDLLTLADPENWSSQAMYQVTRILASNFSKEKAARFYKTILLPRVRKDIRKKKRLHNSLYQSLKKSLYKPDAFFLGILIPLCESGTCNLKEADIFGSIIKTKSIPPDKSSAALVKLAEMKYSSTTSYFIKLLLNKKYALPYRVLDAIVAHFMRFLQETGQMPVLWHQSLLVFVQRYKNELRKEDKDNLRNLLEKQNHYQVTPAIRMELDNSRNRGEKEDDRMPAASSVGVINKPFEEDRLDMPEVPTDDENYC